MVYLEHSWKIWVIVIETLHTDGNGQFVKDLAADEDGMSNMDSDENELVSAGYVSSIFPGVYCSIDYF